MAQKIMVGIVPANGKKYWVFECPGCGHGHAFFEQMNDGSPGWTFNGDLNSPTFSPSLMNRTPASEDQPGRVCHLFLRNGVIEFLSDCTHEYAGNSYPLPDIDGGEG